MGNKKLKEELEKQIKECSIVGPVILMVVGFFTALFGIGVILFIWGLIWGLVREGKKKKLTLELLKIK